MHTEERDRHIRDSMQLLIDPSRPVGKIWQQESRLRGM